MKTKQELIKERNELQEQIDNFKEEINFKKGDYVKIKRNGGWLDKHPTKIFRVRKISNGYLYVECDYWNTYEDSNNILSYFIKANDQEVVEALIKEAKKRGFKKGVEIMRPSTYVHPCKATINSSSIYWGSKMLEFDGKCIFQDGKWAEIIEDKVPEIGSYKMETKDRDITFGCMTFTLKEAKDLLKSMNGFGINCINIEGYDINIDTIEEVINYYNSQKS